MTDVVYVTDLDGTLLDSRARLSPTTRAGLLRLLEEGVPLTVATARSLTTMREILRGIPFVLPVVEMCGAALTHIPSGERLEVADLPRDVARDVMETLSAEGLPPFVSAHTREGDRLFYERPRNGGMEWYVADRLRVADPRLTPLGSVRPAVPGQVVCLTAIGPEDEVQAAAAGIRARHADLIIEVYENAYSPGWWWASVFSDRAQKGPATRRLLQQAGLGGARIVAFGDTRTDLSLFEEAGHAVAPRCASEEVRAAADEVIGCHEEDSVVRWLLAATGVEG